MRINRKKIHRKLESAFWETIEKQLTFRNFEFYRKIQKTRYLLTYMRNE